MAQLTDMELDAQMENMGSFDEHWDFENSKV